MSVPKFGDGNNRAFASNNQPALIRKRLLQYDDVLNQQREVVYGIRNGAILAERPKDIIFEQVDEEVASRLAIAHEELRYVRLFDYLLVNQEAHPEVAVEDLEAIVRAERMRIYRYPDTRIKEIEEN